MKVFPGYRDRKLPTAELANSEDLNEKRHDIICIRETEHKDVFALKKKVTVQISSDYDSGAAVFRSDVRF